MRHTRWHFESAAFCKQTHKRAHMPLVVSATVNAMQFQRFNSIKVENFSFEFDSMGLK